MGNYQPVVGHTVQVTGPDFILTGKVRVVSPRFVQIVTSGAGQIVTSAAGQCDRVTAYRDAVIIERLPDPEPDWQPHDVAIMGNEHVLVRTVPTIAFHWACSCGQTHWASEVTNAWHAGNVNHVLRHGKPIGGER